MLTMPKDRENFPNIKDDIKKTFPYITNLDTKNCIIPKGLEHECEPIICTFRFITLKPDDFRTKFL